jgi:hypothetical protein
METTIKVNSRDYHELRRHVPAGSPAREAFDKATPIAHALEGVEFEGYAITCNEEQAKLILRIAKQYRPEMVSEIEDGITLTQPRSTDVKPSRA